MDNFKGFCPKVKKSNIRRYCQQLFQAIFEKTGSIEIARKNLRGRPFTEYVPGEGYVFSSKPNIVGDRTPIN